MKQAETYDARKQGARCSSCPLRGQTVVPPTPSFDKTRLVIVGEAPGKLEVREGRGFVGPSGKLLDSMLDDASFDRRDAHVTSAILCRLESNADLPRATACCAERLSRELCQLPPAAPILALGASSLKATVGKGGILKARGFVWKLDAIKPQVLKAAARTLQKRKAARRSTVNAERLAKAESSLWLLQARARLEGRVVIPSIHPPFLLRGADAWAPLLRVDIDRAVRYARHPLKLESDVPYVETSDVTVIRRMLRRLPEYVSIDVETDGPDPLHAKLDCVGLIGMNPATGELVGSALVINPWRRPFGKLLNKAMRNRIAVGHNLISFDEVVLRRYGVTMPRKEDTLLAHHAFASHVRQGLDHVASVYTTAAPWKQIHKARGDDEKGLGFAVKDLALYNSSDVGLTALSWMRMQNDLRPEMSVYEGAKELAEFCARMQRVGLRVDIARRDELARKLRARAAGLKGEMRKLLHKPNFMPSKTADIRRALFTTLRAPLFALTPTGLPSTAAGTLEALQKVESRAGTLSDLIIRWRACCKTVSTFLEGIDVARDGRVHASWRAFGTVTMRLSCRDPNLQNLIRRVLKEELKKAPKERIKELGDDAYDLESRVREIYIPAPGNVFVYFDLSQSEMRAAAYLSGDDNFINSCESGDVHTANARILFPYAEKELKDPKGAGKTFRDITKNAGFGILYDAEIQTIFSFLQGKGFDVSLGDVEAMFNEIHGVYTRYYEFCNENYESCRKTGHVREALSGRIRWFGFYPKPSEVYNFSVQAFIAALMNQRLTEIDKKLPRGAHTVAQVHDSGIIEVPVGLVSDVQALVKDVWSRKILVPTSGREFVMPIDMRVGERLSDF
jgi:uracil-DNA glycosylase family 4